MRILSIDTANNNCSVAVSKNGTIISSFFEMRKAKQAEQLLPMIYEILIESNSDFIHVGAYAVNIGPGSFTGIRIGVAAAHGFNIVSKKPVIGVTSLEALALTAVEESLFGNIDKILTVIDARRGEVYIQIFDADLKKLSEPELITIKDLTKYNLADYVVCGNCEEVLAMQFNTAKKIFATPNAELIAKIAHKKIKENKDFSLPYPFYIRKPDAVITKLN